VHIRGTLLTAILVIGVAACATPETPESAAAKWGAPINGDAIRTVQSGATEKWEIVDRAKPLSGTTIYKDDGTATGTYLWNNKETGIYTVHWSVKNDMACNLTVTLDGKPQNDPESCSTVRTKDGKYYFIQNGKLHASSTFTR
jgi:hypothetical protein